MNIKIFSFSFLFILSVALHAYCAGRGTNQYAVHNIPAELLKDAGAVIRYNSTRFEVDDESYAVRKEKFAVTIFDNEEKDYGMLVVNYDKFNRIEELEGKLFDANGEEIRELEDTDIRDYSNFAGYSLYEDNRVKIAELYHNKYPYTVEFSYEISYNGYLNWPSWYSRDNTDPVEFSLFEVVIPSGKELRYWSNNDTIKPQIQKDKQKTTYTWIAKGLQKLPEDATNNDFLDVADVILTAPYTFEIENFKGDMTTWEKFGSWVYHLYKGRKNIPESAITDINNITNGLNDPIKKIEKIYKYMQARTRYVSVQLGIGGWQPFDAQYVHERGYGDCKALSNYMIALLDKAGITAYPVLIKSGHYRLPMIPEFSSNQFNHVIVCVPLASDTVWLECTSQIELPGQLWWGIENRDALLVTPEGGIVVKTPPSSPQMNSQHKKIMVDLIAANANVKAEIYFSGNQQSHIRSIALEETPEEKEKWITKLFEVPLVKLSSYNFDLSDSINNKIKADYQLSLPGYSSVSGSRLFFKPNLMERVTSLPKDVEKRLSPVKIRYPYLDVDSIYYAIEQGYSIETLPREVNLKSSFGEFWCKTTAIDDSKILYIRSFKMQEYLIPPDNYPEYRKFYADIAKADREQVVLVKK